MRKKPRVIPASEITRVKKECLEDFYTFCETALSMPLHDLPHREMATFLSDETQKNKLMLVPRDCWKTSIGSTAFPLWLALRAYHLDNNRNFRSLIDSSTCALSQHVLNAIARYLQNEPNLIQLFGHLYRKDMHKENYLSLNFPGERSGHIREPNFLASGVNAAKTGLHFDLIVMDDLVSKDNYASLSQREKVWLHYRMMYAILESSEAGQLTSVVVIGTRYHDDDLYGRIIKQDSKDLAEGQKPIFAKMIRSVEEDGELFFPAVLTYEELKRKKRAMGGLFWAQYYNDPNKEMAPFKAEQLRFIPLSKFPDTLQMVRMTVDPCIKEDQIAHGDFNAMVVNGWDRFGRPYVLDVSLRRDLKVGAFMDEFFRLARMYNPEQIIIEETTGSLLREIIHGEMVRRNAYFPIFWIKSAGQVGKETRWLKIQSLADRGGIHIAEEIPEVVKQEIKDQWERAPFAQYDDFMDAMEMQLAFMPALPDEAPDGQVRSVSEMQERKAGYDASTRILDQVFPHIRALRSVEKNKKGEELYSPGSEVNEEAMMITAIGGGLTW